MPSSRSPSASLPPCSVCRHPEGPVPEIRPFRALRFDPSSVGDLAEVVAPPYDVIAEQEHESLLARNPANVVRLDLPEVAPGDEPDDRYRRAARTLAAWRSGGVLHKDPHPSIYVYQQDYTVPGTTVERSQRGFFGRLRLESLEAGSGVLPHERTLSGPKEDRYRLLRATGVNTSPVVGLFEDPSGEASRQLAAFATRDAEVDLTDGDGVRHRLWAVPADGDFADAVAAMTAVAAAAPIAIADGHHRYETALRYRDERRMSRSCEEDPAFDYLLMLFLPMSDELTVLPTHRVVTGAATGAHGLLERAGDLFDVEPVASSDALRERFDSIGGTSGGAGRFGLWTRDGGAFLTARREAFTPILPPGGEALRGLDVTLLGAAIERLLGIDAQAVANGAITYTKSAGAAIADVDSGEADAAWLLEGTPVASIAAVARDRDVMPQKSTYFYPKALTGLVINPHEW
jgi:uncharacterized protein (DUF1015 family)